jgi:hypothetical protein
MLLYLDFVSYFSCYMKSSVLAAVESVIWKREAEAALAKRNNERPEAENFTSRILNTTSSLLLSYTGWQEIHEEPIRSDAASKIFRLVLRLG